MGSRAAGAGRRLPAPVPELAPSRPKLVRAEIAARGHAGAAAPRTSSTAGSRPSSRRPRRPTLPGPNPTQRPPRRRTLPEHSAGTRSPPARPRRHGGGLPGPRHRTGPAGGPQGAAPPPATRESAERFAREARAAATIDHPNVCRVYDVGRIDGLPYLTMAYVEGGRWPTRCAGAARGPAAGGRVVRDGGPGHGRGPPPRGRPPRPEAGQHPADRGGRPVVTDFGLARRESADDPRLTATGMVLGTPLYMSPEQVAGDTPGSARPATCTPSASCCTSCSPAGRRSGPTRSDIFAGTLTGTRPGPSRSGPASTRLDAIVLKALAKRPADRFPTWPRSPTPWTPGSRDESSGGPVLRRGDPRRGGRRRGSARRSCCACDLGWLGERRDGAAIQTPTIPAAKRAEEIARSRDASRRAATVRTGTDAGGGRTGSLAIAVRPGAGHAVHGHGSMSRSTSVRRWDCRTVRRRPGSTTRTCY